MSNSKSINDGSLAAIDGGRPSCRLRLLVLALGCALLGACAAKAPAPPVVPTGWQAAIGSLDVTGSPEICTAVLVRADLIATTSHRSEEHTSELHSPYV